MYYFDPDKIKKAYDLLKDCKDLVEAKNDIAQIDNIINCNYNLLDKLSLQQFDKQLRQKYAEIGELQILADAVKWIVPRMGNQVYQPSIIEIEQLKFDKCGIMARILKASGEIVKLADFFDNQYIANSHN
ncbi:MAG: hypothetical protein K2K12_01065 [Clostridia bacterium]|nr:hypothetical protein [Clostridia bacterium]